MNIKKILIFLFIIVSQNLIISSSENLQKSKIITITRLYTFHITSKVNKLHTVIEIAQDYDKRQKVLNSYYPRYLTYFMTTGNTKFAVFDFHNIKDKQIRFSIIEKIILFKYDLEMAKILSTDNDKVSIDDNFKDQYLSNKNITLNLSIAKTITEKFNNNNEVELVKQLNDYVLNNIEYELRKDEWKGIYTYVFNKGKCIDYADFLTALCRSKNIPARVITGIVANKKEGNTGHAWLEVYFQKYGWVPFDPTFNDGSIKNTFEHLDDFYIYYCIGDYVYCNLKWWGKKGAKVVSTCKYWIKEEE